MNFQEAILKAQDAVTVERVYGSPYERDGIVVIPAARVSGAGGGGGGEDPNRGGSGSGGGFGLGARPVGAYVIDRGRFAGSRPLMSHGLWLGSRSSRSE